MAERVLRWGMVKAGELLAGRSGEVGVIRPGARTDLIVLVLEDPAANLLDVMRDGCFHFGRLATVTHG